MNYDPYKNVLIKIKKLPKDKSETSYNEILNIIDKYSVCYIQNKKEVMRICQINPGLLINTKIPKDISDEDLELLFNLKNIKNSMNIGPDSPALYSYLTKIINKELAPKQMVVDEFSLSFFTSNKIHNGKALMMTRATGVIGYYSITNHIFESDICYIPREAYFKSGRQKNFNTFEYYFETKAIGNALPDFYIEVSTDGSSVIYTKRDSIYEKIINNFDKDSEYILADVEDDSIYQETEEEEIE